MDLTYVIFAVGSAVALIGFFVLVALLVHGWGSVCDYVRKKLRR